MKVGGNRGSGRQVESGPVWGGRGRKGRGRGKPQVLSQEEMRRHRGGAWEGEEEVSQQGASRGGRGRQRGPKEQQSGEEALAREGTPNGGTCRLSLHLPVP